MSSEKLNNEQSDEDQKGKTDVAHARKMFWSFIIMSSMSVIGVTIASLLDEVVIGGVIVTIGIMIMFLVVLGSNMLVK